MDIRSAYLDAASVAAELIGRREAGERWGEESVLPEFPVRGLAGHLARSILQVEWFLDMPQPDAPPISAVQYYAELAGVDDVNSELNVGVRSRGEETAAGGWARLYLDVSNALDRLRSRLPEVDPATRVLAFGRSLPIDEYLKTRLIELTVHTEDLALSVGVEPPELPEAATTLAIAVLVGVARARHGDAAVLHALTRRERDVVDALRVL
ncbi:MAG TPA: maleylpyruvate isomerase N-terminal domain-containing protein [Acidimicrobiales bacterium]|nr:maleylpyruvate isomerase N-terminal domain-containing protein [Acidimicrobiales bacterium]